MISALSFLNLQNNYQNFVLLDSSEFPAWPSSELVSVELPLAVAAAAVVVVVAAVVLAVVFAVVVVAMAICNAIASVVALRMIPEEKASFCLSIAWHTASTIFDVASPPSVRSSVPSVCPSVSPSVGSLARPPVCAIIRLPSRPPVHPPVCPSVFPLRPPFPLGINKTENIENREINQDNIQEFHGKHWQR